MARGKVHVYRAGSDMELLCGETAITSHGNDLCGRCDRQVQRMYKLLEDCRHALWQEQHALADDKNPRHRRLETLMRRIDRVVACVTCGGMGTVPYDIGSQTCPRCRKVEIAK